MSYPAVGAATATITGVTTVDCQKQVRSWRLFRSLMEFFIPTCNWTFAGDNRQLKEEKSYLYKQFYQKTTLNSSATIITGTLLGYRRGKVSFCIQTNSRSHPVLLLELAVPTTILAREMQGGILRIALECTTTKGHDGQDSGSLLSMPVWSMYCNGRKVGYAVKRRPTKSDVDALHLMSSVIAGAGIIRAKELDREDELMYLRANFERVCGSSDSESFHLIDPEGNIGQELSIFFVRSRWQ